MYGKTAGAILGRVPQGVKRKAWGGEAEQAQDGSRSQLDPNEILMKTGFSLARLGKMREHHPSGSLGKSTFPFMLWYCLLRSITGIFIYVLLSHLSKVNFAFSRNSNAAIPSLQFIFFPPVYVRYVKDIGNSTILIPNFNNSP